MKRSLAAALGLVASVFTASCTPEQIAAWEMRHGTDLAPEIEADLLALDHTGPVRDGSVVIEVDGRLTPVDRVAVPRFGEDVERWHDVALDAGWHPEDWPWLSCVINRESKGDPRAHALDSDDDSWGLLQINLRAWRSAVALFAGVSRADTGEWLADPSNNLRFGRWMFDRSGRSPWKAQRRHCLSVRRSFGAG